MPTIRLMPRLALLALFGLPMPALAQAGPADPAPAPPAPVPPAPPPPAPAPPAPAPAPAPPDPAKNIIVTTNSVTSPDGTTTTHTVESRPQYSEKALADAQSSTKFGGAEFGVGVALTVDLGAHDRVLEAEEVDGVVRVTKSDNVRARLLLELHYFFTPRPKEAGSSDFLGLSNITGADGKAVEKNWGFGPFLAIQPGDEGVINAMGAGFMFGFRRPDSPSASFNFGLGVLYDLHSKVLGDDVVENEPLPGNEKVVRFKERDQLGALFLFSFTF